MLSLLSFAGYSVVITVSCDEDEAEMGEDEELVDKPRATRHMVGYIAINSLAIADEMWFLTAGPVV